jgi:hypothetical protein
MMLRVIMTCLVLGIVLVLLAGNSAMADYIWPITGSVPDDLSSTFGPRLKASESYRYDFHRGIDIPADCYTEVRAIADGTVRLSGYYDGVYSDRLVQVRHTKLEGGYYYSNYMHLASASVKEDKEVKQGRIIGYSGESNIGDTGACDPANSNFDHLHFEIRDEGLYQKDAIHPLIYLPYDEATSPQVSINNVDLTDPLAPEVNVTVEVSKDELDLNRVEVIAYDKSGESIIEVDQQSYDMMEWNLLYSLAEMDDPDFNGMHMAPAMFNASSSIYSLDLIFKEINGVADIDDLLIKVRAIDINGTYSEITAEFSECPGPPVKNGSDYYYSLQETYDKTDGGTIQSHVATLAEDLYIDNDISIIIQGGYDCGYTTAIGLTTINGDMIISDGNVTLENIIIQ